MLKAGGWVAIVAILTLAQGTLAACVCMDSMPAFEHNPLGGLPPEPAWDGSCPSNPSVQVVDDRALIYKTNFAADPGWDGAGAAALRYQDGALAVGPASLLGHNSICISYNEIDKTSARRYSPL